MPTQVGAPNGSITDVPGVLVGHHQRVGRGWQTGTTAVIAPGGAVAGVDVRGGGPGTRETDALDPRKLVPTIHGVCLSGGSAYGLRAADGVMDWLEERQLGFPVGPDPEHIVPVVPAAVIFDLGRGGRFENRPDHGFGHRAARTASARQSRWGAVGAGTGARTAGLQGGVGTASTIVEVATPAEAPAHYEVGAIAVVNSNGSPIDPRRGLPWDPGRWRLRSPSAGERRALVDVLEGQDPAVTPGMNTTIGVVATSARLTRAESANIASVAHDGLARAIRPAHSLVDGDTIFGLATGARELPDERVPALNQLLRAAADTFADACVHAVLAATVVGDLPTYIGLCPSARR